MSAAIPSQRVGSAHVNELYQVLARGQSQARTALIDVNTMSAWALGKTRDQSALMDQHQIAAFGSLVFAPQRVTAAMREEVHEMIAARGGISMVAILMRDCDLFLGLLPSSSNVVSLVVRHNHADAVASDTVVRGRSIRARMDPSSSSDIKVQIQEQTTYSYSIWRKLFDKVMGGYGAGGSRSGSGVLERFIGVDHHILSGDLFDLKKHQHVDHFEGPEAPRRRMKSEVAINAVANLFSGNPDISALLPNLGFNNAEYGKVQVQVGKQDFYWLRIPYFPVLHLPFDPDRVLMLYKDPRPNPALDWVTIDHAGLNLLRMRVGSILQGGLHTTTEPFPETQREFQAILDQLGALEPGDLINRLDIGGFLPRPKEIGGVKQRCKECIYYLPHRKWCDLPELPVPVEPDWWCRLWKL